jgi:hypothetical protein
LIPSGKAIAFTWILYGDNEEEQPMESNVIYHAPRGLGVTVLRSVEYEHDCPDCPDGQPDVQARCRQCASTMVYRGLGTLRNGIRVHYFECVHSPAEVHGMSFVIAG